MQAQKITIAQAAQFLETTEDVVRDAVRRSEIPGAKMGKHWIIPRYPFYRAVNRSLFIGQKLSGSSKRNLKKSGELERFKAEQPH